MRSNGRKGGLKMQDMREHFILLLPCVQGDDHRP